MPYKAGKDGLLRAAGQYRNNVRKFDPEAEARVQGMADGSGIPFDEMFALQCYSELFVNYPGLAGMCTSFAITGEATKGGVTLLGQTVDWNPDATVDLVRIHAKDGDRMLVLFLNGYGAFYLASSGMGNCANLTLCPSAPVRKHVPFAFYLYAAMRRRSAKEAMDILSKTSRGVGYIHIGDSTGFLSGIESVYDDFAIVEPRDGVLVHANHYETEKYQEDRRRLYLYPGFIPAAPGRLRALIAGAHGGITHGSHDGVFSGPCRPSQIDLHACRWREAEPMFASMSLCSFIMIPGRGRECSTAFGPPCENEYVEYLL